MDILDLFYYVSVFLLPLVIYLVFSQENGWSIFYLAKYFHARRIIKKHQKLWQNSLKKSDLKHLENVRKIDSDQYTDSYFIYGLDQNGNCLSLRIHIRAGLTLDYTLSLRLSDGRHFKIPGEDGVELCSISGWHWKTKNLHVDTLEPFKRLRITYNGLLHNLKNDKIEHLRFYFTWAAAGRPQFHPQDAATELLATTVAQETWRDGDLIKLMGGFHGYTQFGALQGHIMGDSFTPEGEEFYLQSSRIRIWGRDEKLSLSDSVHFFGATENGLLVSFWTRHLRHSNVLNGCITLANGTIHPLKKIDVCTVKIVENMANLRAFTCHVTDTKSRMYKVVLHMRGDAIQCTNQESDGYRLANWVGEGHVDTTSAFGLVDVWKSHHGNGATVPPPLLTCEHVTVSGDYVINFRHAEASNVKVTGGKGSSLALLAQLNAKTFTVPDGFIVTVNAFKKQLWVNPVLEKSINTLDSILCGKMGGDIERACAETTELFRQTPIPVVITDAVKKALNDVRCDDVITVKRYAVRSSGVTEDGDELSAAGQNDTFLGCQLFYDIIKAISDCWASLFTYQSVKYRHQNGLPVKTQMAVVVQLMVPAECAGVLFTCHPSTANPDQLVITANHGLGESVVSGRSEPDTLIVSRGKDFEVISKMAGTKATIISMSNRGVTELPNATNNTFSITDAQAKMLAQVGVDVEECFGNFRDIEWAFYKQKLYLLQSRPVTTLDNWSDLELLHEFDVASRTPKGMFTMANVGEVLPGAISALTASTVLPGLDRSVQKSLGWNASQEVNTLKCVLVYQHHVFIDPINSLYVNTKEKIDLSTKIVDLAVFGHPIINQAIHDLILTRQGYRTGAESFKHLLYLTKLAWINAREVAYMVKHAKEMSVLGSDDISNVSDIYRKIDEFLEESIQLFWIHSLASGVSVFYQMLSFNILGEGSHDFGLEHYSDIADLLSSCNEVVSVQIPTMLEQIAKEIESSGKSREFTSTPAEQGVDWMTENAPEAAELFRQFLEEHGHRGNAEFELKNATWASRPADVIRMLQANCQTSNTGTNRHQKITRTLEEVVKQLKSPKKGATRSILKFLMKHTRIAVGRREQTKNELIRIVSKIRLAYKFLAGKMTEAGLIPEEDLIFHLTHYEIGQIIENDRSPTLIRKALRRQRLYPKWNELTFPEVCFGTTPQPETPDNDDVILGEGSSVQCQGTPVYAGVVKARACVILDLKDANLIEKGDILITYSTDIGWTAHFPMLAGLVTELGGLVSHGAVIAREYGLPCIVGVQKATKLFKTGDSVNLSGNTGLLEMVSSVKN